MGRQFSPSREPLQQTSDYLHRYDHGRLPCRAAWAQFVAIGHHV